MKQFSPLAKADFPARAGSALIVVLAMVVLLTGLLLAFLSRSILEHQISTNSSSQTKADLFARGAVDTVIGDLRQEIVAGSTATTVSGGNTLYRPMTLSTGITAWGTSVPAIVGFTPNTSATQVETDGLNNLVKISAYNVPFYSGANYANSPLPPERASSALTTAPSLNSRLISATSWNKPLLVPSSQLNNFPIPNWVMVARDGSNPTAWNANMQVGKSTSMVVGRYAYTIYNEGGLLDMNVAGSPAEMTPAQMQNKSALAFADLTQIGLSNAEIDALVGWRNYASAGSSGSFPAYSFNSTGLLNYFNNVLTNPTGFLLVNNSSLPTVSNSTPDGGTGQSDQMFGGRQQLIQFLTQGVDPGDKTNLQNALQYMGTFTRALNQPSYFPDPNRPTVWNNPWPVTSGGTAGVVNNVAGNSAYQNDNAYNPAFRTITAKTAYTRNDGSLAVAGEPLVKKRFALNHLAWLSYKGPSAGNMNDSIVQNLITLMGGNPANSNDPVTAFVAQGTAANIYKYFGLTWTTDTNNPSYSYWVYDHGFIGSSAGAGTLTESIGTLAQVQGAGRDADFFELLKAALNAGSVGYSNDGVSGSQSKVRDVINNENTQVDNQVIQIGANMINQFWPDNFPAWIVVNYGTKGNPVNASFWGKVDLPYFYGSVDLGLLVRQANPAEPTGSGDDQPRPYTNSTTPPPALIDGGQVTDLQVPIVWNPHSNGMPALASGAGPTALRISISNFNAASGSANSNANNFFIDFYPCTYPGVPSATPGPGLNSGQIQPVAGTEILANNQVQYWNVGTWDPNTGTIIMPSSGYNTSLYFNYDPTLYREPTPLMRTNIKPPGAAKAITLTMDNNNILHAIGNFSTKGVYEASGSVAYLGFFKGSASQCWLGTDYNKDGTTHSKILTVTRFEGHEYGCTVSLEYQSGGAWIPYYQSVKNPGASNVDPVPVAVNFNGPGSSGHGFNYPILNVSPDIWRPTNGFLPFGPQDIPAQGGLSMYRSAHVEFDPRSRRWIGSGAVPVGDFLDSTQTTIKTYKPDTTTNDQVHWPAFYLGEASRDMYQSTYLGAGSVGYTYCADTITPGSGTTRIVRRATGAYVTPSASNQATTTVGMPLAPVQGNSANQYNRPIILHRPFRSVAELSYVFTDTPWKNINFFTPESGDSALLDVFCINDNRRPDALTAGRVDLNTRQPLVLQAILAGANRDENGTVSTLSQTEAAAVAKALVLRTGTSTNLTVGKGPLYNVADLVGRYGLDYDNGAPAQIKAPYDGFSADLGTLGLYTGGTGTAANMVPRFLQTALRALSDTGQAGTWNLMIDLVAQTGRYPATATGLDNFLVEGQRRYWVHLAIDRQTGQVIDQQIETVSQ